MNDIIARSIHNVGVPATLKLTGLLRRTVKDLMEEPLFPDLRVAPWFGTLPARARLLHRIFLKLLFWWERRRAKSVAPPAN